MSDPLSRFRRLLRELKRRKVYRVAVTYAVVAAGAVQLVSVVIPASRLPAWSDEFFLALAVFGFPIAVVLAWAFEVTPEGVRRTEAVDGAASEVGAYQWIGLAVVVLLAGGVWYATAGGGGEEPAREAAAADTASTAPRAGDRSIAVLPFENMGGEESEQFTQGVHDGLLTRLSNISDLKVISRTSVMQYEGTDKTVPQIARELGAQWVVEGAVQQAGGQVQVNAQLIDARDDAHQWARNYQRELSPENLFAIQSELTKQIARSLAAELSPEEQERVERQPTTDLTAYRLYAQGRRQLARRSEESVREAVENFRQAIARDSSFALAWSGLADAAGTRWWGFEGYDTLGILPEEAARRALKLAPEMAEPHASMGFVHMRNLNGPAALEELHRAIELRPSYWEAHNWLGRMYYILGRPEKSLEHSMRAVELNPQHAHARHHLYDAYLATGQARKSLEAARRQQQLGLEQATAVAGEIRALYHLGRLEEARQLAREQISKLEGGFWPIGLRGHLAAVLAADGDTAGARAQLDWIRSEDPDPFWIGFVHVVLGETDRAFEAFGRIGERYWASLGFPGHLRYGMMLDLSALREDSRYEELIRRANQKWGLNPDGSLPDSVDVSFNAPQADE